MGELLGVDFVDEAGLAVAGGEHQAMAGAIARRDLRGNGWNE